MRPGKRGGRAARAGRTYAWASLLAVAVIWLPGDPAGGEPIPQSPGEAAEAAQGTAADDEETAATDGGAETAADAAALHFKAVTVVTASRRERPIFDEPASVVALSVDDLKLRQKPVSFVDAFRETAAVSVQKTAQGQGSPYIRGFTGYNNLMLIDGVRFNNSILRSGPNQYWATIDLMGGTQVELIKGPGSVLYGSDAVGGTVNVLTRMPPAALGAPSTVSGRVYTRLAAAEESSVLRAELEGTEGRLGYAVGASLKGYGDFRAGGETGRVVNSAYDEYGFDSKLLYQPRDDRELVFLLQAYRQDDVPRTETTIFSKPFRGTVAGTELRRDHDQERQLSYLRYRRLREGSKLREAEYTVSFQRAAEDRLRVRGDSRSDRTGFEVTTIGAQAQFGSVVPLGTLTYGVELYRDSVDSFRTDLDADGSLRRTRIQGPIADDASYSVFGLYLQDELSLADRWLLVLGGRFSSHRLSADRVEDPVSGEAISLSDEWSNVVGSLRVLWRPQTGTAARWRLFASMAQAFRAPNLSDLTSFDATSAIETPTPGLRPEKYLTVEAGARYRSAGLDFSASYFHTRIEDQIVQSPTGRFVEGTPEVQKSNVGDGFVAGVEMALEWRPTDSMRLWANGSWIEGEVDQFRFAGAGGAEEVRAPVSRLVPWMGHAGILLRPGSGLYWVEIHGTALARADRLALRDVTDVRRIPPGGTPGFAVLGIRAARELEGRGLTLAGGIENLLDEDHRIHGSGQNMPGRNLVLTVEWAW